LINYLDEYGLDQATPRMTETYEEKAWSDFSSGYIQRAVGILPKQAGIMPWVQSQSYYRDLRLLRFGAIEDGVLEFTKKPVGSPLPQARREPAPVA